MRWMTQTIQKYPYIFYINDTNYPTISPYNVDINNTHCPTISPYNVDINDTKFPTKTSFFDMLEEIGNKMSFDLTI
jgi:hypothetical protein